VPVVGTLTLTPADSNPLYTTFSVSDLEWRIRTDRGDRVVTGSGTYRVGGEVAVSQQLTLALKVGDEEILHFDSGLVPEGNRLPDLDAVLSVNGMECYDRVFRVHASSLSEVVQRSELLVVPGASSLELSLFTGGAVSALYGTLRIGSAPPAVAGSSSGVVAVKVEAADLIAPALSPGLPGVGETLRLTLDPRVESVGTWDPTSSKVDFDLHLVAPAGNLPVPMPLNLKGTLDGSRLVVAGDNGAVPDATLSLTLEAIRLTNRDAREATAPGSD
jgi:hypothetical protein